MKKCQKGKENKVFKSTFISQCTFLKCSVLFTQFCCELKLFLKIKMPVFFFFKILVSLILDQWNQATVYISQRNSDIAHDIETRRNFYLPWWTIRYLGNKSVTILPKNSCVPRHLGSLKAHMIGLQWSKCHRKCTDIFSSWNETTVSFAVA